MKTTATTEAVSSPPEEKGHWGQKWRQNTSHAGQKPRADWKNDLQTYKAGRESQKPPTPVVGQKPNGKYQFIMIAKLQYLCILLALLAGIHQSAAQGTTAFTYQGQLHDTGTNANGAYTMTFKLYDAATSGNQIGSTLTTSPTLVNGLFTVNLDFGAGAFNGSARWLDITVAGDTLTPRVQVLPTPYAQFAAVAATVTNGAIMNAQLAANAIATTNIQNGAITTTQIANGAVTNANLTANAVATTNIQNGAITTALIANGAVTNQNLTANAVNATNIANGQVVKSLNGFTDGVNLYMGENVTFWYNPTTGYNINNGFVIAASPVPNSTNFTANGTFIVPTDVTKIMVEAWGAGGGGGSGTISGAGENGGGTAAYGGGGGAGGYAKAVFSVIPGSSHTIFVGLGGGVSQSGGSSGIDSASLAAGGSGGQSEDQDDDGGFYAGEGGSGGVASTGINGGNGRSANSLSFQSPDGGGSPAGGSGGFGDDGSGDPRQGTTPGGGGGGGLTWTDGNDDLQDGAAGASGGNGRVIIYY